MLTDWWVSGSADGQLGIAFFFLLLGGLFGWCDGGRCRMAISAPSPLSSPGSPAASTSTSRATASAGILAFVIAFLIQVAFLASFLPAVLANGTTAGADADWWLELFVAMTRVSLLTAVAAVLGVALATLGRNTAFALITVFAWVAVVEGVVRGLAPSLKASALGREPRDRLHLGTAQGRGRSGLTGSRARDAADLPRSGRRRRCGDLPAFADIAAAT